MPSPDDRAALGRLVDATTAPALTDTDLDELLNDAARTDTAGLPPSDPEWDPTYDLDSAAAGGWLRKAGRAASAHNFSAGSIRSERAQVHQHCLAMAQHYQHRAARRRRHGLTSLAVKSATVGALEAAEAEAEA